MKETMKYELQMEIDGEIYTLTGPAYKPMHSLHAATSHFFLVTKEKLAAVDKKLEEDAKAASEKDPEDKKPETVEEEK